MRAALVSDCQLREKLRDNLPPVACGDLSRRDDVFAFGFGPKLSLGRHDDSRASIDIDFLK